MKQKWSLLQEPPVRSGTQHPGTGPWSPCLRSEEQRTEEPVSWGASRSPLHWEAPGKHITDKNQRNTLAFNIDHLLHIHPPHTHLMSEKSMNRQIYSGCKPSKSSGICVFFWVWSSGGYSRLGGKKGKGKKTVGGGGGKLELRSRIQKVSVNIFRQTIEEVVEGTI